jgi:hypothetical protein
MRLLTLAILLCTSTCYSQFSDYDRFILPIQERYQDINPPYDKIYYLWVRESEDNPPPPADPINFDLPISVIAEIPMDNYITGPAVVHFHWSTGGGTQHHMITGQLTASTGVVGSNRLVTVKGKVSNVPMNADYQSVLVEVSIPHEAYGGPKKHKKVIVDGTLRLPPGIESGPRNSVIKRDNVGESTAVLEDPMDDITINSVGFTVTKNGTLVHFGTPTTVSFGDAFFFNFNTNVPGLPGDEFTWEVIVNYTRNGTSDVATITATEEL